jgi:Sap, sulfolipid-1-addressing protein
MWSSVVVLALLAALNPVRLGLVLLVVSRPRPVQNLLAFWIGCLAASIAILLVPLIALHVTPMFRSLVQDLASPATLASSTVRHIQVGMGVLTLSIAR